MTRCMDGIGLLAAQCHIICSEHGGGFNLFYIFFYPYLAK